MSDEDGGGTDGGGSGGGSRVPDARDASAPSGGVGIGVVDGSVGGIKDGSAAAADVVFIVPSPANAKKTVPPVAAVAIAAAAAARTAEVSVGNPVDRSDAAVKRQITHNKYQRIHMVRYRTRI